MSGDPIVSQSAQNAIAEYGTSVSASRLLSGERSLHREIRNSNSEFNWYRRCHCLHTEEQIDFTMDAVEKEIAEL
ncbi:hypothetical protein H1P_620023 [Hyella patelloides LEGE 07179]|uniref:Uncharacterized protein n=1 Tax=Hyella patelloides LEGE 07179 TaxID=945734 RepID=A0A563W1D2_9CYAN|nr:hypothetical protein [Hyella patelloides]VEP17514.1 hypothetical protein H1P_620023 [Hyella patelloides LEGE 07179]